MVHSPHIDLQHIWVRGCWGHVFICINYKFDKSYYPNVIRSDSSVVECWSDNREVSGSIPDGSIIYFFHNFQLKFWLRYKSPTYFAHVEIFSHGSKKCAHWGKWESWKKAMLFQIRVSLFLWMISYANTVSQIFFFSNYNWDKSNFWLCNVQN